MRKLLALLVCLSLLAGCAQVPQKVLELPPESLQNRQLQTRRFETIDREKMLAAASNVLQDLGFTLEEAEIPLGVLTGSKTRSAVQTAQATTAIVIGILGALAGSGGKMPAIDAHQTIRVCVVMRQKPGSDESTVRATFQRVVVNTENRITKAEQINDVAIYKEFFEKLSKSVFLEAHEI